VIPNRILKHQESELPPLNDTIINGFKALRSSVFYLNSSWSFLDSATILWFSKFVRKEDQGQAAIEFIVRSNAGLILLMREVRGL
jgi:hypothetical protein